MKLTFNSYDLSLAVTARRTLLYEFSNYSNEDRQRLVFHPAREFLGDMAKEVPKQVTCFFGSCFQFPKEPGCSCRCLYIINRHGNVAYLGTIFNQKAITCYQARLPAKDASKLSKRKVSRGRLLHCIIPTQKETIDELVVIEAVKKFFTSLPEKSLIPNLANTLICLLSVKEGAKLEMEILRQAKLTAKPVSKKEKLKKFMEDMVW